MRGGLLRRSQSERCSGSDSQPPQMRGCKSFSERALAKFDGQWWNPLNLRQPSSPSQPPFQRQLSASSSTNNSVVALAEESGEERQISNRSIVNIHRLVTNPPANTSTTDVSSTPQISRHVSTNGNGVSLLRQSNISSSADSDMMIRRRMITEEEWNGAPHAYQKTTDHPNNLGRYKLKARQRRKRSLKQVE